MAYRLAFFDKYRDEATCIQALADLKWPDGFSCTRCQGRNAYRLACRPRLFECAACGHQHSVTAGTIFHKTRTPLRCWFIAAYLIAHDKRGVSALYLSRELAIRYDTAWLMCHKIRHALTESRADFLLGGHVEVGETSHGGTTSKGNRGRAQTDGKAIVVCAVERRSIAGTKNQGISRHGFIAGGARIAVLANATAERLGGFIRSNVEPGATIISNGFNGFANLDEYRHSPPVPGAEPGPDVDIPIVRRIFSNVKAWLNGTHHGVSAKHLPRYLREWAYRFNRRSKIGQLDGFLLRRTIGCDTITYAELAAGKLVEGAIQ